MLNYKTWAPLCSWKTVVRKRSQKLVSKDISDMSKVDIQKYVRSKQKQQNLLLQMKILNIKR